MWTRGDRQSRLTDVIGLGPAIVLIAIGIFTGGCGGNGRTEGGEAGTNGKGRSGTQGPQTTIVFLDPTTIQGTDGVRTMVADSMRSIAKRHLQTRGDKVLALPIRRRTEVKTPQVQLRNRIDPSGDAQFVDQQAMQDAVVEQKTRDLVAEAESLLTRFVGEVAMITRTAPKGPSSDLLGAVEVIREETRPNRARAAYFFSDMFHSLPTGRRDFEENPPSSRAEAREWARRDAERIRKRVRGGREGPDASESRGEALLKGTTIRMTPGSGATRPASPRVEAYWRALFAELGCDTADITYN
jgi:hypothetical protein